MGEPKDSWRGTKNSQRVASLEDQNKVLEQVLKASREAAGGKNKSKTNQNKSDQEKNDQAEVAKASEVNSDKKRKAEIQGGSPSKKSNNQDVEMRLEPWRITLLMLQEWEN